MQQMQQKVDHLSSEAEGSQAREQEWELKFEKEKQALREEAAAQSLIRNSDQVLMRKELRDIQSRLRILQVLCFYTVFKIGLYETVYLKWPFLIFHYKT
jgi:hypothetical protein